MVRGEYNAPSALPPLRIGLHGPTRCPSCVPDASTRPPGVSLSLLRDRLRGLRACERLQRQAARLTTPYGKAGHRGATCTTAPGSPNATCPNLGCQRDGVAACSSTPRGRAMLRPQSGPHAADWRNAIPSAAGTALPPDRMLTPLPASPRPTSFACRASPLSEALLRRRAGFCPHARGRVQPSAAARDGRNCCPDDIRKIRWTTSGKIRVSNAMSPIAATARGRVQMRR